MISNLGALPSWILTDNDLVSLLTDPSYRKPTRALPDSFDDDYSLFTGVRSTYKLSLAGYLILTRLLGCVWRVEVSCTKSGAFLLLYIADDFAFRDFRQTLDIARIDFFYTRKTCQDRRVWVVNIGVEYFMRFLYILTNQHPR